MITTNIAAHVIISNMTHTGRYGGGGGKDPQDDPSSYLLILALPLLFLVLLFGWVVLDAIMTDRLPVYEVNGRVVAYSDERSGKATKVFVHLLQDDGQVRKYNTDVKPEYCRKAPANTIIPVIVHPSHSRLSNRGFAYSNLKYNPCK